ncbi:MAG: hypothetical protein EOO28_24230 [Comamonadaceae bacterium]|nr:MAG: hypothetical protein EOO28_24230 [Comamonadaceae bacterium]
MDSAQAAALKQNLKGKFIGGWLASDGLGHGKSAVVVLATKDGVSAALKVFHPELVEQYGVAMQLERIARERSLIGAEHPNLVKIYDGGQCVETGYLYVVMELLPTKNLEECLSAIKQEHIRPLISQLASAAKFLEEKGLAHRDIKPSNIAINEQLTQLTLLDLGVVRPFGIADLTDVDQRPFIGTLRYSSPEFLLRQEEDTLEGWRAVSIYQIGAVLHDLLMKKPIFFENSEPYSVLVEAVLNAVPEIYASDSHLVQICKHSLVKNPKTRSELVGWQDFEADQLANGPALGDLKNIKARQKYARELSLTTKLFANEEQRILNAQFKDFCNRLETAVSIALNTLNCFPLRSIRLTSETGTLSCSLLLDFEKDIYLGLPTHLSVELKVALIDSNSGTPIYIATTSSQLSPNLPADHSMIEREPLTAGSVEDLLSSSAIESRLAQILSLAYAAIDANENALNFAIPLTEIKN